MPLLRRRFSLREFLVITVVLAILGAIGIQILSARRWDARRIACASNLRSLWQSQFNYAAQYGGGFENMSSGLGGEFHLVLQRGRHPVINRYEPFFCPIAGEAIGRDRTSYRGPAIHVAEMKDVDPVAADKDGNHGPGAGGNVLFKLGDVEGYFDSDPLWRQARVTTRE